MLADKSQRTKISLCGINPSVGRRMAKGEFKENFSELKIEKGSLVSLADSEAMLSKNVSLLTVDSYLAKLKKFI